jgi:hypothetical protein
MRLQVTSDPSSKDTLNIIYSEEYCSNRRWILLCRILKAIYMNGDQEFTSHIVIPIHRLRDGINYKTEVFLLFLKVQKP